MRSAAARLASSGAVVVVGLAVALAVVVFVLVRTTVSPDEPLPDALAIRLLDIGDRAGRSQLYPLDDANGALRLAALMMGGLFGVGALAVGLLMRARVRWWIAWVLAIAGVVMVLAVVAPSGAVERAYDAQLDDGGGVVGLYCTSVPAETPAPAPQRLALCNLPHAVPTSTGEPPTEIDLYVFRLGSEGPTMPFTQVVSRLGAALDSASPYRAGVRLTAGGPRIMMMDGGGVHLFSLTGDPAWAMPMDAATFDPNGSGGPLLVSELQAFPDLAPSVTGLDPNAYAVFLRCEVDPSTATPASRRHTCYSTPKTAVASTQAVRARPDRSRTRRATCVAPRPSPRPNHTGRTLSDAALADATRRNHHRRRRRVRSVPSVDGPSDDDPPAGRAHRMVAGGGAGARGGRA